MSNLKDTSLTQETYAFLESIGLDSSKFDAASMTDTNTMKANLFALALIDGNLILQFPDESNNGLARIAPVPWVK